MTYDFHDKFCTCGEPAVTVYQSIYRCRACATFRHRERVRSVVYAALQMGASGYGWPCVDRSCVFGPPPGMHTNGGCQCLKGLVNDGRRELVRQLAASILVLAEQIVGDPPVIPDPS